MIIDKNNNVIKEPDLSKGYLIDDKILIAHHEAIKESPGKFHYEVLKEYPNGGKDVIEVCDEEPTLAKDAWDEYKDVKRYIEYTKEQLREIENSKNKPTLDSLNEAITDIQMAMAETYESDDSQITDLQMAIAELYEMISGGNA